ncbi:hypothetical protein EPUL_006368 [Erysiphe pulchra]|uniref:Uncharacterized protein n=1 Tax=Erysiphe pulchra TaxID=225359 RepID=A0A2S4PK25_9PEZI|nr:hypothetical protein EPUL_006368 [Erysiphe pulchra]
MTDQTDVGQKSEGKRSESPLLHHESLKENWLDGIDISSSPTDLTDYISLKFRKLLREHGIHVRKTKVSCSIAITEALNSQYHEWTKSEVEESLKDKTFSYVSGKLQYIKEQLQIQNSISKESSLPTSSMIATPMKIDTPSPKQFGRPINPNQTVPNAAPHNSKHLNPNPSNPLIHI